MSRKGMAAATVVLGLVFGACSGVTTAGDPSNGTSPDATLPGGTSPSPTAIRTAGALVQFDACEAFLDYVIPHAVDIVGPYGFDAQFPWQTRFGADMVFEEAATDAAAGPDFSSTNVQVAGVDEPDIVKTDGERIVVLASGDLIVVDVTGEEPEEIGRIRIGDFSVQNMFLSGNSVLLFGSVWNPGPIPLAQEDSQFAPAPSTPTVRIVEVDISSDPEKVRSMEIDGAFISGRMVDDSARLVLTSGPVGFEWSYPKGSGLRAEREATEANREIVRNSKAENWIPYYVVTDEEGDVTDEGLLFACDRASHPSDFSGIDMLSVVSIDLGDGLDVVDATGVLATGDTVYSSPDHMYVATQNWQTWEWLNSDETTDAPEGPTTDIHLFDISDPTRTEYVASGSVGGYLVDQFAMDEYEGVLRVASTTTPARWWGSADSESRVSILEKVGGELIQIGMVDGLGKTEQVYSVRFLGDAGYVVTFRQTDPLYTIDLSDPRDPEVMGELKIPGYSAYLHPIGDDLILGVGQDATEEGRVLGTQASVFDVSDLSDPKRLDSFTLSKGTNSEVEYDHHAFLYWEGLVVIPMQQYWWEDDKDEMFMGAVALRVTPNGELSNVGDIAHPGGEGDTWDGRAQIRRSVVIGDSLFTISDKGIMKSDLATLDEQAWLDF